MDETSGCDSLDGLQRIARESFGFTPQENVRPHRVEIHAACSSGNAVAARRKVGGSFEGDPNLTLGAELDHRFKDVVHGIDELNLAEDISRSHGIRRFTHADRAFDGD